MNATFRTILALSITLAACGHGQDLLLDQASTALGCGAPGEPSCTPSDDTRVHHAAAYGDAGAPHDGTRACREDADCGYAKVCERRHGVSSCQVDPRGQYPSDASADAGSVRCNDDDAYDDRHGGHGGRDESADEDAYDRGDEDRSGSNSGRH